MSREKRFTPGPWYAEHEHRNCSVGGGSLVVAEVTGDGATWYVRAANHPANTDDDSVGADSHLIAAAPDLLEAAEHILAIFDHPTQSVTIFDGDRLRDAIAKAYGEE